ncbi:MAG: InlB B-repeat-containing protein [Oscillospiraceae bacterium]
MKKKLLALFLCCALSFGLVTAALITPASADTDFMVYQKGTPVTAVELPENGSATVEALLNESASGSFQWQIMARGVWANVIGATGSSLTLRYAMLANVLNGDGQASVRCRFTPLGAEAMYSNIVTVQMIPGDAAANIPADDAGFDFTVLDPGSVVKHETAAPAQETPAAPTENTAPAGDAAIAPNGAATGYALVPSNDLAPAGDADVPSDDLAPANDTPDVKQTYNIVINYRFENGTQASDSYTATLAEGESFSASVTFPTVQGYLPYVGESAETQSSIELNYPNISENVTITVTYKPTNVNYTVIHYQQNVDNDNYTEAARETLQGLTGSQVPEAAKEYLGFYSLIYEHPAIAADGSTVIEIYYDRYYFLMLFDMDGGYGTDPIYVRYGAPIGTVNAPTKAGYEFGGWSLTQGGDPAELPTVMPAANSTYYALWTPEATAKVTIVFWGENADDEDYSYLDGYTKTIDCKPGTEFTYSESGMLLCALEVHTHDLSECYTLTCTQEQHTHSESCNTCGKTEHTTHTTACYAGVGDKQNVYSELPRNPVDGQVTDHWYYGKLIYINGSWYRYSGATADGATAPTICHTHTDACLGCGKTEHTHSVDNGCYERICGKTAHTHNSDCYMNGAGLDSNLWKFVRSDTVTVAANGSSVVNVYYDRTEKTLTYKYKYSKGNYQTTETITAKWGADISEQYKTIASHAGSTFWSAQTSGDAPYTNYFGIMPQTSATYYNRGATGDTGTMTYWGQDLNGEYTVKLFEVTGVGGYYVSDEDRYDFEGFTYHHGTDNYESCEGAAFYYTRNSYKLAFNNQETDVKTETVLYQAPLSTYDGFAPEAPGRYEPNSVQFAGWYQNPECTGEEYVLNEHTMPANDLILYAKWVPVTHTVKFYLTEQSTEVYKPSNDKEAIFTVEHGGNIAEEYVKNHLTKEAMNRARPNGDYNFVVWYYYENGARKYFDPTMQIRTDLTLFAEWNSDSLKQYTVRYVLQGTDTKVADDLTGSGLAGTTKTFDAKGGTELYAEYQEGYFPHVQSQSLLLDIEADSLVITFEYVQMPAVPYTVKYINTETNTNVFDGTTVEDLVVNDNRKAVVTETFKVIPGFMPDAYQKRLVVTADGENILYFYYTRDSLHAYYKITHYTENLAKDAEGNTTWTEYASSQAQGDIGATYSAEAMSIPGFTFAPETAGTVTSGELTAEGLELKLYYTRNPYPYQVRYLEQGTGNVLAAPKDGSGLYGQVISESAIDIGGYDKVDPTTKSINIRIESDNTAKLNIITFYYTENTVNISYVPVGPDGAANFGTVDPASETVKIKTGTAAGSVPTPGTGFKFVGWYKDSACTVPVAGEGWLVGTTIKPQKDANGNNTAATYYAKFEYDVADLTITKYGCEAVDENQSFVFTITGDGTTRTVVINGNGSVTIKGLKAGTTYTVTEDSGWSWRYEDASGAQTITLQPGVVNNVAYSNRRTNPKWLGGDAYTRNIFGTLDTVSGN